MKIKGVFLAAILTAVLCISGNLLAVCPSMDATGDCRVDFADFSKMAEQWLAVYNDTDLAVMASQWLTEGIQEIVWVDITDASFVDQMSKYETTNAQYCQFLNAAKASGDITVSGSTVYGANGSNSGADFVGQVYYNLAGPGYTFNGATDGGAARINYTGGIFTVDSGFENHPVTYISWYGATAFCNYYGYRLPAEWEWQAVADYDGSYAYGCGTSINNSIANYYGSTHPNGTAIVGAFGTYGYGMCDMAGNAWEWTSSCYYSDCSYSYRVIRGSGWSHDGGLCAVSSRFGDYPDGAYHGLGFRVCR